MSATMSKKKSDGKSQYRPYNAVRIPADLYERMKKLADANDRTATKEIVRAIKTYLEKHEQPPT